MKIHKKFAVSESPFKCCEWAEVEVKVVDQRNNSIVFHLPKAEVPKHWSRNAVQIFVSKYFRMAGVPKDVVSVAETDSRGRPLPEWLQRRIPAENTEFGTETSVKQVVHRMSGYWTYWGWKYGYFDDEIDAKDFYGECIHMLLRQWAAPNTPQFFSSGVNWAYGTTGSKKGMWRVDPETGEAKETDDFFTHPGTHACFIVSVEDTLLGPGGVYDNLSLETRAFTTGGGVGANFSTIRAVGEKLSSGNDATGLMSFLKVFDRSAGTIRSGSTSRRAAKMVVLNVDHPEIEEFIEWKAKEEKKARALINAGYDGNYEGEAYKTVSGQNSNNSIRITNAFMKAVEEDGEWDLIARTTGKPMKTIKARELWNKAVKAAWECADPGVQFDDLFNDWNTCSADGRINASNPCSEYQFLDNTACNLASINLQQMIDGGLQVDLEKFQHVCRLLAVILDISNNAGQFPSKSLAEGTYKYRSIGVGHTGLGAVFMQAGVPYDDEKACHFAAAVTALMTGYVYEASQELAERLGSFPRYSANATSMCRVLGNHAALVLGKMPSSMSSEYFKLNHDHISSELSKSLRDVWLDLLKAVKKEGFKGFRNAFVTLIQPSGSVGLIMDCDTLAIEPDFSLIKCKKLSGGGSMKIVNEGIRKTLVKLGYAPKQIEEMMTWVLGHNTFKGAPYVSWEVLKKMGVTNEDLEAIEAAVRGCSSLRHAFKISNESKHELGIEPKFEGNVFKRLNFTKEQYAEANGWICGHGTFEGAPHLKKEHLVVFDCANKNGDGSRAIPWEAHVKMMAAVMPFLSGSISKTINMPNDATVEDISQAYKLSHKLGVRAIAVYRDGCKVDQPLFNPADLSWWDPKAEVKVYYRGQRKKPPKKRLGFLEEAVINDSGKKYKIWVQFYEYEDGSLCEIWLDVSRENPDFKLALKWWARAMSNAIQYGQPLDEIGSSFLFEEGGPAGATDHKYITYCKSIPDFVMKLVAMHYLGDTNWCKIKPPISELRCGHDFSRQFAVGETTSKMSPANRRKIDVVPTDFTKCGRCGGTVNLYPCPTCTECGFQPKGCSP
ncbi:MAG: adenosylcobalamin-dependent ribonucleoside-diphosphate reductase [Candidatus Nanopelagicaceae bacterium]|nr:adenosylcobalamin-dependent ribonucleoside-diphosphate reductase [Candidatus Nanopelagicaceae bacterium]